MKLFNAVCIGIVYLTSLVLAAGCGVAFIQGDAHWLLILLVPVLHVACIAGVGLLFEDAKEGRS